MAEGSRLDLSLHQVGRIRVLKTSEVRLLANRLLNYSSGSLAWRPIGPGG
jgi:hypothetical protein